MNVVAIIPARMKSTRFPGKPLSKILGYPMIEHVYKRAKKVPLIKEVYIATCDREIAEATEKFGGKAIMTSDRHTRGTDRVAEAAKKINMDYVLNIQGDEPLINPDEINDAISIIIKDSTIKCINFVSEIDTWDAFNDYNVVKTVVNTKNEVLYFSRKPIPTIQKEEFTSGYKQIGIYIFKKQLLLDYTNWDETPLEKYEMVDMLRILEFGYPIKTFLAKDITGVDTPEDLARVEKQLMNEELFNKLFNKNN